MKFYLKKCNLIIRFFNLILNIKRTTLKIFDIDYILGEIVLFLIGMIAFITALSSIIGILYRKRVLSDYDKNDFKKGYIFYYKRGRSKENILEIIRIIFKSIRYFLHEIF